MGPSRLAVRVVVLALAAVGAGIVVACRQESPPPPPEPAPVVTASTAVAAPVPTPENTVALLLAAAPELTPQSARTLLDATSAAGQDATTLARVSLLEAMAGFARLTPDQLRELNGLFAKAYDHLASADRADVESYLQGVRGGRPGTTAAEARARRLLNGAILALSPSDRERLQALYGAAITASLAAKRETARRAAEPPPVVSAEAAPPFPPRSSAPAAATGRTAAASGASSSSSLDSAPTRGRGEAYWRNRAQQLRAAVARLERTVADLDAKATNLAYGAQSSRAMPGATAAEANAVQLLNAVAQQNWQAERTKVMGELERARRALASAKQELDNLDDEARRDGALPGWLR